MFDENRTGFEISGSYTLLRAAKDDPDSDMPETTSSETVSPETVIPNETTDDWQEIYYERYYAIWDSEEMMLSEIAPDVTLAFRAANLNVLHIFIVD